MLCRRNAKQRMQWTFQSEQNMCVKNLHGSVWDVARLLKYDALDLPILE